MRRILKDEYLKNCHDKFGNKYEYLDIIKHGKYIFVKLKCDKHGIFNLGYYNLLNGSSCPKCQKEKNKKYIYGFGINDYSEEVKINGKHIKSYHLWIAMLQRCYDKKQKKQSVIYEGCSVCEEWRYFSNFKKWFDENYIEGFSLDKDIINKGNKIYSPDNCAYVTKYINSILLLRKRDRGKCPLGVHKNKKGVYISSISKKGKIIMLGCYTNEYDAFNSYKINKEKYIKDVATEYYNKKLINKKVYEALMNWEININD